MAASLAINSWTGLEKEIQKALELIQRRHPALWHRFYDTKSANNYLPTQPADFLLVSNGRTIFIEAKFSKVHESLRQCFSGAVSDEQMAAARMASRAGAVYALLFYSRLSGRFEVWPGNYCAQRRLVGKPLELVKRAVYDNLTVAVGEIMLMAPEEKQCLSF